MAEKSDVLAALSQLSAFATTGGAVVNGEQLGGLVDALAVVNGYTKALGACLAGATCPAKITQHEIPSGLVFADPENPGATIPAPGHLEFSAEFQAP